MFRTYLPLHLPNRPYGLVPTLLTLHIPQNTSSSLIPQHVCVKLFAYNPLQSKHTSYLILLYLRDVEIKEDGIKSEVYDNIIEVDTVSRVRFYSK